MAKVEIEFIPGVVQKSGDYFKAVITARTSSSEIQVQGQIEIVGLKKDQKEILDSLSKKVIKLS